MLFDSLIARFRAADRNTRLETLLDYSRKFRDLPAGLPATSDRDVHRVTECQTPVFLWIGAANGAVTIQAEVPRESPTVRGFVALLQHQLTGATPERAPVDLERLVSSFAANSEGTRDAARKSSLPRSRKLQMDREVAERETYERHRH